MFRYKVRRHFRKVLRVSPSAHNSVNQAHVHLEFDRDRVLIFALFNLLAESPHLSAPPISKIGGGNVNTKLPECRVAKMAVVWPLHRGVGIIALSIRLDFGNI